MGYWKCTYSEGRDFTVGRMYFMNDDGNVTDNVGYTFEPYGFENAIEWLHRSTSYHFIAVNAIIYKPGDRVVIVDRPFGHFWNPGGEMDRWIGKTMTIDRVESNERYRMKEDKGQWAWYPDMIASLAPFCKEDLRSGDLMKTRQGRWYMYFDNGNMAGMSDTNGVSFMSISEYESDLRDDGFPDFDVMQIYRPTRIDSRIMKAFGDVESILYDANLVFDRKERKEITMEEALDALRNVYGEEVVIAGG